MLVDTMKPVWRWFDDEIGKNFIEAVYMSN